MTNPCPQIVTRQENGEWIAQYAGKRFPIVFNSATEEGAIALATKQWDVEQLEETLRKRFYQFVRAAQEAGKKFEEAFMSTPIPDGTEKLTVSFTPAPRAAAEPKQEKAAAPRRGKKQILVKRGSYRNMPVNNQAFPLIKPFQAFSNKEGGFVTVDGRAVFGKKFDKIRVTVSSEKELGEVEA